MNELDALLVLNAIDGIGCVRLKKLLDHYGSARNVLSLNEKDLASDHIIPPNVVQNIFHFPKDNFLKSEYNLITKNKIGIVSFRDKDFPAHLLTIIDPPVILYVKGRIPENNAVAMAIVGSRRASVYGITIADKLAVRLSELGLPIVSGMARGIDTAAHKGALKVHGETVAVLGCGLAHIYPPENKGLFVQIANQGAVISEFPMETPPAAFNLHAHLGVSTALFALALVAIFHDHLPVATCLGGAWDKLARKERKNQ